MSLLPSWRSQQSGIPHHLILAQAALESGWGQRQILTRDGKPSYNVFGIKASGDWKGETTDIMITEYEGGEAKKVRATFCVLAPISKRSATTSG